MKIKFKKRLILSFLLFVNISYKKLHMSYIIVVFVLCKKFYEHSHLIQRKVKLYVYSYCKKKKKLILLQ